MLRQDKIFIKVMLGRGAWRRKQKAKTVLLAQLFAIFGAYEPPPYRKQTPIFFTIVCDDLRGSSRLTKLVLSINKVNFFSRYHCA